jgi:dinuclear metal center YbgI/SA1388 family protein
MPSLASLIDHLDRILDPARFADYGPNGLQVPGPSDVGVVVTGVSAHAELLEEAAKAGADLVLVHHGLFWRGGPLHITPAMHRRLGLLYRHDMALAAYHLPLDAHPEHGNNALLADALGLEERGSFAEHGGHPIGVHGRLPGDGLSVIELAARVADVCDQQPLVLEGGPDHVRTLGIVSGGACDDAAEGAALGLDAFLTGEPTERAYGMARDEGITIITGGHHATETFGIRRIGDLLAAELGVTHVHIDVRNPI